VYHPETVVVHHQGKSTQQAAGNMMPQRVRSVLAFCRKHYAPLRTALIRGIVASGAFVRLIMHRSGIKKRREIPETLYNDILRISLGHSKKNPDSNSC